MLTFHQGKVLLDFHCLEPMRYSKSAKYCVILQTMNFPMIIKVV